MCQIENDHIRSEDVFEQSCERAAKGQSCCRSYSLGNYVAVLVNKSSCDDIDANDVAKVGQLLLKCREYFHTYANKPDCWNKNSSSTNCASLPRSCKHRDSAIYHIFIFSSIVIRSRIAELANFLMQSRFFLLWQDLQVIVSNFSTT